MIYKYVSNNKEIDVPLPSKGKTNCETASSICINGCRGSINHLCVRIAIERNMLIVKEDPNYINQKDVFPAIF